MRSIIIRLLGSIGFLGLLIHSPLGIAEEDAFLKCRSEPTEANCSKLVKLPAYCQNINDISLYLGYDVASGSILITMESSEAPPIELEEVGSFFAANGRLRDGAVKEVKMTRANCSLNAGVYACKGLLSLDREAKISNVFNFEQEVVTFLLRDKKLRDVCIGKLVNDETILTRNGRLERQYCEFTPNSGFTGLQGAGFFDPKGYGTTGDAHLHVAFEGFSVDQRVVGCSELGNRYQEVFRFAAYDASSTDAEIYGTLSEDEKNTITQKGPEYSYDLYRELTGLNDTISTFARTLGLLNRQISSSAAVSETRDSNKKFAELKRKQKKKKQEAKNSNQRSIWSSAILRAARTTTVNKTEVFQWLAFDPLGGGDVIIAPSCKPKVVNEKAYGILSCNVPNSSARGCYVLSGSVGTAGKVCLEERSGYKLAIFRVEGLADGSYYVCNGSSLVASEPLVVTTDNFGSFGELQVSDNSVVAGRVPGIVAGSLTGLSSVSISSKADCSLADAFVLTGSL
jgi:hypothetical protein